MGEFGKTGVTEVAIVPIIWELILDVTQVHLDAYAGNMNTRIGSGYVRAFLNWFCQAERSIALAATDGTGNVIGYVVGAPLGYQSLMNRDLLWIAGAGMIVRRGCF